MVLVLLSFANQIESRVFSQEFDDILLTLLFEDLFYLSFELSHLSDFLVAGS